MQILEEVTNAITDRLSWWRRLILIVVIMFAPMGFAGFLRWARLKMVGQTAEKN